MALTLLLLLLAAELGAAVYLKRKKELGVTGPSAEVDREKLKAGGRRIAENGGYRSRGF